MKKERFSYPLDKLVAVLAALVVTITHSGNLHPVIFISLLLVAWMIIHFSEVVE